jgi:hypothetical protein
MSTKLGIGPLAAGTLGAIAILAALPADAAEWEMNPRIEAGYLYDDNYRLAVEGGEVDVSGPLLDAAMEFRALSEVSEFSLTPRIRATYFPDNSDLDSVDYFTDLNWERRGQRVTSRLRGEVAQQDVVSSEQPTVDTGGDLGEPDLGDAGRVLVENRRLRASLRPSFSFDVSERREMTLEGGYTHVSFDEQISEAQVDYDVADVAAGLLTRLSERNSFTTRLRAARYDIDNRAEVSNGFGAELQWDRLSIAETRSYLRLGAQQVELVDGETEVAWLAGAGMNFLVGRNELFLDASRSVGPSSAGVLVSRDQLRLRWTRAFSPRMSLLAGLRGTHDEDLDDSVTSTFTARSYATGDLGLQWRWQEEFTLRVAYDYTWQEFDDALVDATSSGAMVSITYEPLQRRR